MENLVVKSLLLFSAYTPTLTKTFLKWYVLSSNSKLSTFTYPSPSSDPIEKNSK